MVLSTPNHPAIRGANQLLLGFPSLLPEDSAPLAMITTHSLPSICFPLSPHPFPACVHSLLIFFSQGARPQDLLILAAGRALQSPVFRGHPESTKGHLPLAPRALSSPQNLAQERAHRVGRAARWCLPFPIGLPAEGTPPRPCPRCP